MHPDHLKDYNICYCSAVKLSTFRPCHYAWWLFCATLLTWESLSKLCGACFFHKFCYSFDKFINDQARYWHCSSLGAHNSNVASVHVGYHGYWAGFRYEMHFSCIDVRFILLPCFGFKFLWLFVLCVLIYTSILAKSSTNLQLIKSLCLWDV